MEWTSTIVMKLKTKNDEKSPLPSAPSVEVVLRHFHWHCYKSSPLWFVIGGTKALVC
jgi:hypothetical protein